MGKSYQNEEIDTSQPAVPDTVSVALAELAGEMREGLLALAVGTGCAPRRLLSHHRWSSCCSEAVVQPYQAVADAGLDGAQRGVE